MAGVYLPNLSSDAARSDLPKDAIDVNWSASEPNLD